MSLLNEMLPGLIATALGLIAGAFMALRLRKLTPPDDSAVRREDLDERLGHALAQLRELVEQEGRLTPESFATERARLEQRAADIMRQRDLVKPARTTSETPTPVVGFLAARPGLRGFIWGGGTVGIVAALFLSVSQESTPSAPMQGGPTQAGPMQGGPMAGESAEASAEIQGLIKHLTEQPGDVAALVRLGHLMLRAQMLSEAQVITDRALQLEPENGEALVHAAVLKAAQDPAAGNTALDDVIKKVPALPEAWFFRGMLAMRSGDTPRMQESFEKFMSIAPDGPQKDRVRAMLQSSR